MASNAKHYVVECFWINAHQVSFIWTKKSYVFVNKLFLMQIEVEFLRFWKFLFWLVRESSFDESTKGFVFLAGIRVGTVESKITAFSETFTLLEGFVKWKSGINLRQKGSGLVIVSVKNRAKRSCKRIRNQFRKLVGKQDTKTPFSWPQWGWFQNEVVFQLTLAGIMTINQIRLQLNKQS